MVKKIESMKVEIKEGSRVVAKSMIVLTKENGEAIHEVFIPFELIVNGKTYGDTSKEMPI